MSWSALSVARYADEMSRYSTYIQSWLNVAHENLFRLNLVDRFNQIADISNPPSESEYEAGDVPAHVYYSIDGMDRQFAILELAISNGTHFEFSIEEDANGWILNFIHQRKKDFTASLADYLTEEELLQLKLMVWQ